MVWRHPSSLRHDVAPKVLVHQARAGELGGEAVAKDLGEAPLVVVIPLLLCRAGEFWHVWAVCGQDQAVIRAGWTR